MNRPPERLRALLRRGAEHLVPTAAVAALINMMVMLLAVGTVLINTSSGYSRISEIQELIDVLVEDIHPTTGMVGVNNNTQKLAEKNV